MSWHERVTKFENRMLDRSRSAAAATVAHQEPTGRIDDLRGRQYCVLVTYKKNGDAIPSPLWFGIGEGKLYTHTLGAKVRRIANNPNVLVAPCTFRGRPLGPPFAGTARAVEPSEAAAADAFIQANYGWKRTAYLRVMGQGGDAGVHIEVTPK